MPITRDDEHYDHGFGLRRELDAGHLGRVVARRALWILVPTLLCLVASTIGVNLVRPRYMAEAKILLENQESFFTRPDRSEMASQSPLPDDEAVQSQVQLITSRDIARDAVRQLGLPGNVEFDPAAGGFGPLQRLLVLLGLARDPLSNSVEDRLLTAYYERLNVYPVAKSRVLSVQFTSVDPDLAAKAANTVSDLYIDLQSDAKRNGARVAGESLATLIADLKVKLLAADTKAQEFRASNGLLVGTNNTTITSQQLSDLTSQLAQARNAQAESEAKAKLLREMIRQNRTADVPDVANSDLIRRISEQRITLKAQIAQQAMTLLPQHPRMREMSAQLADLDNQLRVAGEKVARALENDSRLAAGRVDNLAAAIETQKQTATTAGTDQVRLNELEQQTRLLRDQLDFNTQKYQEALARENAVSAPADARVISRAVAPELPSFPKKLPMIAIFTLAGLVLSLGIVLARELLSGRAFVSDALRPTIVPPAPALLAKSAAEAVISPDARAEPGSAVEPDPDDEPLVEQDPDLVTMLDMVADYHREGGGVRLLVLRSEDAALTAPGSALTLARALARSARVVLVDCGADDDLESLLAAPRSAETPAVRGLTNLLDGDTSFAEVIHRDPTSRLHIVPLGTGSLDKPETDLEVLVDALAETYDHVVLAVPMPDQDGVIRGASQGDLAILFVTSDTALATIDADRAALHQAGVPSVYVLDVAELGGAAERPSAAAA